MSYMSEHPAVYDARTPRARKDYPCSDCSWGIARGERYHYLRALWDGRWSTVRTCERCQGIFAEIAAARPDRDDHPPFGHLYPDLCESQDPRAEDLRQVRPRGWTAAAIAWAHENSISRFAGEDECYVEGALHPDLRDHHPDVRIAMAGALGVGWGQCRGITEGSCPGYLLRNVPDMESGAAPESS